MKFNAILLCLVSILSANLAAKSKTVECPQAIKNYHLGSFLNTSESELKDFSIDGPYSLTLKRRQFEKLKGFKNFNFEFCKNALKELIVETKHDKFQFLYTSEDSCDGGNSYGAILKNGKEIGQIQDQEFYCR